MNGRRSSRYELNRSTARGSGMSGTKSVFTATQSGTTEGSPMNNQPRFYQKCKFWMFLTLIITGIWWLAEVAENPGCPEVHVMENFIME